MKNPIILSFALMACGTPTDPGHSAASLDTFAGDQPEHLLAAPAPMAFTPFTAYAGETADVSVTGGLSESETVYVAWSKQGEGAGPCSAALGGGCFDLVKPKLAGEAVVDDLGVATLSLAIPDEPGQEVSFQAWVVRGVGGEDSITTGASTQTVLEYLPGCMDPVATDYDPAATFDDGSCSYPPVGPEGSYDSFESEGRTVWVFQSDPAASLSSYETFCEDKGVDWFVPKSSADGQLVIDNTFAYDSHHTWVVTKNNTEAPYGVALWGGHEVVVDSPSCVETSSSGFSGIRKWGCSLCDPDLYGTTSCWDAATHDYDWLVCES